MGDLRAVLPGLEIASVRRLGAGLDNVAYLVNGELVVRWRRTDPADVEREARLLRLVAEISPLPVPRTRGRAGLLAPGSRQRARRAVPRFVAGGRVGHGR